MTDSTVLPNARWHALVDTTGPAAEANVRLALPSLSQVQFTDVHPTHTTCAQGKRHAFEERARPAFDAIAAVAAISRPLRLAPRLECRSLPLLKRILTEPATRSAWVKRARRLLAEHDGVMVDFVPSLPFRNAVEARAFRKALVSFVGEVHKAKGDKYVITSVIPAVDGDEPTALSRFYDLRVLPGLLFVKAWNEPFDPRTDRALNPESLVKKMITEVQKAGRAKDAVLAVPLQVMDLDEHTNLIPMSRRRLQDTLAGAHAIATKPIGDSYVVEYEVGEESDAVHHTAWFGDGATARSRAVLARNAQLLGMGFVPLGYQSPQPGDMGYWKELIGQRR